MTLRAQLLFTLLFCSLASAQLDRVTRPVNVGERVTLTGNIHPNATPANDQGRVAPSLELSYVTLTMTRSPAQQADLTKLLADQQNPASPNYHQWLTPEQYADRFGVSQSDMDKITSWLRGQGLTVANVARGRSWVAVNGSAAQVEAAFQTELHEYQVNGEKHFANATEPSVPTAIGPLVLGIRGLNNFRMKALSVKPRYNSEQLCGGHCLAPDDFATIYSVMPLYAKGIDGTGQKIAVAGQTDIYVSDIATFRSNYGLPANPPQLLLIPNSADPGVSNQGDLPEADLDIEWSGAVAKNATIVYVYSTDVMNSVQYAIDEDLAPVVSSSYGLCEPETYKSDAINFQAWAQQGNTQGITWVNASGDAGAADCDDKQHPSYAVDTPADVPEITGVGGTEFSEGAGTYWAATNNPATGESALSYIPETSWNDSINDGMPSASGGGASIYFAKPSWQTGPGVPGDGARDVPDVSLSSSADHDGYLVETGGTTQVYGGTSVSAQVFAGIAALVNQYLVSSGQQQTAGLGNANVALYSLAQSSTGIFNDITTGNNDVSVSSCSGRIGNCTTVGYNAGPGYDLVSGLGSVNVEGLASGWHGVPSVLQLTSNLSSLAAKDTVFLIATATDSSATAPAGTVTFTTGTGISLGSASLTGSDGVATATLAVTGSEIGLNTQSQASQTITATYKSASATMTANLTLNALATSAGNQAPLISGSTNAASFKQVYAPGMILAVFGSQLAPSTTVTSNVPFPYTMGGIAATINGEAAPLWYLSSTQLNIQIPYETAAGAATLEIDNNGQVTTEPITVAAAAPGIFTDSSGNISNGLPAVAAGQETVLYLTGAGAVTPAIASGEAPASGTALSALPSPAQTTSITVGGLPVPTPLQFNAITPGLVGVVQVNFTIPGGVPAGRQPVVVTVGGAPSAVAYLTVAD